MQMVGERQGPKRVANLDGTVSVKICLFSLWVMGVLLIKQEVSLTWSGQLYIIASRVILGCS